MSFDNLLRQRASVQRCQQVVDDTGMCTEEWTTVAENIPCLLQKVSCDDTSGSVAISARAYFNSSVLIRPSVTGSGADRLEIENVCYRVLSTEPFHGMRLQLTVVELVAL